MLTINRVQLYTQRDMQYFVFPLSATELMKMGRVERFEAEEEKQGVNRRLNEAHAFEIATAMADKSIPVVWEQPFRVHLEGGWEYQPKEGKFIAPDTAYLSLDDGQHRHRAFTLLVPQELVGLEFQVHAFTNLTIEQRIQMFRMKYMERPLDARLSLAMRNELGKWTTQVDKEAYELTLALQNDSESPLKGMILLTEGNRRPREEHGGGKINAQGLFATIRTILGNKSPISEIASSEGRKKVIFDMLGTTAIVWKSAWMSNRHILTTARGITAILQLFIMGAAFRGEVGKDFSPPMLKKVLGYGSSYDWGRVKHENWAWRKIAIAVDQSIQRGSRKMRPVSASEDDLGATGS